MKVLVNEHVVKNIKYESFDGKMFLTQKECEDYEHFHHFMKKFVINDHKSEMMINLFNTFFKTVSGGLYTESKTFVLKYSRDFDKEFFENIALYIKYSFDKTDTYMDYLNDEITKQLKNYCFDDEDLVLVYFVYDSDFEGNCSSLKINLINKKEMLKKLDKYKIDIENAIVDAIATLS